MSVIVELVFTGIVAFVPLGNGRVAAVMPNDMPSHIPWIIVNKDRCDPACDFDYENAPGGNGAWRLGAVQLSIHGAPRVVANAKGKLVSPSGVASLKKIEPGSKVKKEYLESSEGKSTPLKSMWFELPQGTFSVKRPTKCEWDLKAEKVNSKPVLRQKLAQEVVYEVKLPDSRSVTLVEKDLATGKLLRKRVLAVKGNRISIMIGHTPPDQIFPAGTQAASPDEHFKLYYRMLSGVPGSDSEWPIPFRVDPACREEEPAKILVATEFFRVGGDNCPPAFMY